MNLFNELQKGIRKANPRLILAALPDIRGLLEEREYRKMEKLGQKLGVPVPGMFLRRQIFLDKEETFDSGMLRSHTVNRNYYNLLFCQGAAKNPSDVADFGTGFLSVTDTGGTIRGDVNDMVGHDAGDDHDTRGVTNGLLATAGTTTQGIVAGTNSGAEDFEDFALGALIANGNGAGQLDYAQSGLHVITNAVLTLKDTLIRNLNNNSGGGITAEEIGIYTGVQMAAGHKIMITRDLTGGDLIPNTAQFRVTYEITLAFP